ncbi:MAG: sigma-70 family RNA polymerase sigma factor [Verrucomicrobiae bacterium]|nr:sigma-70 family RNA polymerase sigma factor [Verrucomicrobiae bacterium]
MDETLENKIRDARNGNPEAFEPVVRRFERPLRAWLATQAPPGVDVDDIAQRSFIAAYDRLSDYEPGTNFSAWLFTIARYQLRTETTRLRRVADYHTRYAPDLLLRELERREETQTPEEITERLEHLKACLSKVDDNLKKFLTWRYEEEIPLEEMATRSHRSVAAVKKVLWKLRRSLHDCITQRMNSAQGEALSS